MIEPKGIAKVFHDSRSQVIRNDGRYLNFGIRAKLPA